MDKEWFPSFDQSDQPSQEGYTTIAGSVTSSPTNPSSTSSQEIESRVMYLREVSQAKAGSRESFVFLYQQHKQEIYSYLRGLIGNDDDAHDLTQKTFLNVLEKLSTLQNITCFKSWLYTVAKHTAYDYLRSEKRRFHQTQLYFEYRRRIGEYDLEEAVVEAELIQLALTEVHPKYRECLLLQNVGGFTQEEIADIVGVSKESVRTYISNARKQLRQAYQCLKQESLFHNRGD